MCTQVHKFSVLCLDDWVFDTSLKSAFTCNIGDFPSQSVNIWFLTLQVAQRAHDSPFCFKVMSSRPRWWRMNISYLLRGCAVYELRDTTFSFKDYCILVQTVLMDPPGFFSFDFYLFLLHPPPPHCCAAALIYQRTTQRFCTVKVEEKPHCGKLHVWSCTVSIVRHV